RRRVRFRTGLSLREADGRQLLRRLRADASGREYRGRLGALGFGLGALGETAQFVEQLVQRLVGNIGGLGEGTQKAVGAGKLEQRLIAIAGARGADQHDIVERLQDQLLERLTRAGHVFDDAAARAVARLL